MKKRYTGRETEAGTRRCCEHCHDEMRRADVYGRCFLCGVALKHEVVPNETDVPHWDGVSFTDLDVRHWLIAVAE